MAKKVRLSRTARQRAARHRQLQEVAMSKKSIPPSTTPSTPPSAESPAPRRGLPGWLPWVLFGVVAIVAIWALMTRGGPTPTLNVEQQVAATVTAMAYPAQATAQPEVLVAPTNTPDVQPPAETFQYNPGGDQYSLEVENLDEGWQNIRRTANGKTPAWVDLVRITCESQAAVVQWHDDFELIMANNGNSNVKCTFEVKRNLAFAAEEVAAGRSDPYDVANSQNSPLGLGWFTKGNGATVNCTTCTRTDGSSGPVSLNGIGVYQVRYAKNFAGILKFEVNLEPNGSVTFNRGELFTSTDTWTPANQ